MDDGSATRRPVRRNALIGGMCVAVLVAAGSCLDGAASVPDPGPSAGTAPGPRGSPIASSGLLDRPTRGSLASDIAFVDGVRALPWGDGQQEVFPDGRVPGGPPEPPPDQRTVVFAGDVPGGRWAVVVGPIDFGAGPGALPGVPGGPDLAAAVFTGPRGAAPEQMTIAGGVNLVPANWTPALLDPTTGTLLVVATPGEQVEVSEGPEIAADGSGSRDYRQVETTDGIAVVRLPTRGHSDWASTLRVVRQGRPQSVQFPWPVSEPDSAVPDISIGFPRGEPSPTGREAAAWTAEQVLAEVGLPSTEVEVVAQWVGPMPGSGPWEVAVVTVTLPSGALVVSAQLRGPDDTGDPSMGSSMGGICGRAVLPAGPPASRRVYALPCDVVDVEKGEPLGSNLVVVAPRNVALVRTYDSNRAFLSEHPAVDGVVVVPLSPDTDTVEGLTPGGITSGRVELIGYAESFGD
ncbi:MAG: hypothetical protein JWR82_1182 [Blastococcus sp.]|nr:hypothetical protein [Blastococcus sp.]